MKETKVTIEFKNPPNVLMLGNGINCSFDFPSGDKLIKSIQTKELTDEEEKALDINMPFPLKAVILTEDNLNNKMKDIAKPYAEFAPSEDEKELIKHFTSLPFDAVLTTNYTYEIEKSINPDFKCTVGCNSKYRKSSQSNSNLMSTYFDGAHEHQTIWHIHGEAGKPNTMVIGHYYYGNLLSKMQQQISNLKRRYNGNFEKGKMDCWTWIDYFMLGNVYIVGQGMDQSEIDLWWLINCKKRHFPETKVILYKPDIRIEQRLLAEAYGVKVCSDGLEYNNYRDYYKKLPDILKDIL